mmetsp:Transcript_1973/g.3289  ORF Transcript_1973/g.3289 Transcript_1973/m.3289 type:complete len:250 (-) Transcript_1973:644-1393(-)
MTNVCLGQLVVTKIKHFVSAVGQCGQHFHFVFFDCVSLEGLQRDYDIGVLGVRPAVTQLGHVARIDELVEFPDGTGTLGDRDRHEGLGGVRALRDEAKSVKVHISPGGDGDHGLAGYALHLGIFHHASYAQSTGRLDHTAGVVKAHFNRRANFIGLDGDHAIDQCITHPEGLLSDSPHSCTICEQTHRGQGDHLASLERLRHSCGIVSLHTKHLHLGLQRFDISRHPCKHSAPTAAHKHAVNLFALQHL